MKRVSAAIPAIVFASSLLWLSGCENGAANNNNSTAKATNTANATTEKASDAVKPNQLAAAGDQTGARDLAASEIPVRHLPDPKKPASKQEPIKIKPSDIRVSERMALDSDGAKLGTSAADRVARTKGDGAAPLSKEAQMKENAQFINEDAPTVVHAEPPAVDLGEISTSDVGLGSVKLVNTSDKPMRLLECKSSCGCTTTNCPKGQVIPAHEFIELEVRLTAGATPNDHLSKSLTYIVEDHPMITVPVTAKVVSYIAVTPTYFDTDKSLDGKLTLHAIDDQPFVVTSMIPAIIDEFSTEPAATQELNIDWDKWVESGHRGRITIYTTHPKCRAVYAQVRGIKATEAQQKWAQSRPNTPQRAPGLAPAPQPNNTDPSALGSQFQPEVVTLSPVDARLHANAKVENIEELKKAIAEGGNVNAPDASGKTPLHVAATAGKLESVKTLIESGADLEARDRSGRTPLMWAVESRSGKVVAALLTAGADVNARDETGGTPLMWAAGFGDESTLRAILSVEPELSVTDDHGMTPLMWAASFGDGARVKVLLEAGLALDVVDATRGCSALMYAARSSGPVETLKALIEAGADLKVVDVTGRTALAWAALLGTPEKVQILLDAGADVTKEDFRGWTPLTYAKNRRDRNGPNIAAILEDATAKAAATTEKSASAG